MSRYHYSSSPASSPAFRSPSRWPWIAALGIVVIAVGIGVGLLLGDVVDVDRLRRTWTGYSPTVVANQAAEVATVPTVMTTPDPAVAPAAGGESQPPAARPETTPAATDIPAAPAPTVPPSPTSAPTAVPPETVAATYVERWSAGNYNELYDLLSTDAQQMITRDEFIARYDAIAERAGLTTLTATVDGEPNLQREVPIRVEMTSEIVGEFVELNRLPMVRDGGDWKVAWTPSLIFKDLGADGCVDVGFEQTKRGSILDRDGDPLAFDGDIQRVVVVPGHITDEPRLLRELSELTGMSEAEVKEKYEGRAPEQWWPIQDFPAEREGELLNALNNLAGAGVRAETARIYPMGDKAAHITGYVSPATAEQLAADPTLVAGQVIGQAGIEAGADDVLTGEPGGRLVVVQCETRAERATIADRPPVPAKDLVLTIDRALQETTVASLKKEGDVRGSAVLLDPRSGAVLALASVPSFDPNGFVVGFSDKDLRALGSETRKPLLNRAAQAAYPTGSIFKAITFSAAMKHLGYTADTVIDCPATFSVEGSRQVWEDWTVASGIGPQGPLTLHQALVNSCNTVFYQLGRDLDDADDTFLPDMTKAFGLGAPTNIPYLPEVGGIVPDPAWKLETFGDYWATGDAVNLAIGQGFLAATPLQMATAYAAIANGGSLLQPFIVESALTTGGTEERLGERIVRGELPLSQATIRELQSALRDQTSDPNGAGSYKVFGDFTWPIAGKTGTAQNQINRAEKPHSWFAAFGPYGEEATITSVVMIESVGEGISYAAPVTRRIYEAYLNSQLAASG